MTGPPKHRGPQKNFTLLSTGLWINVSYTLLVSQYSIPEIHGTFVPENESSIGGTFILGNFCPLELSVPGTFVPWSFVPKSKISIKLSFHDTDNY